MADILKLLAFGFGLVQGLVWGLMSLICIIVFIVEVTYKKPVDSYGQFLNALIYFFFLNKSEEVFDGQIMRGGVFCFFMIILFVLHICWLVVSILVYKKDSQKMRKIWCILTWIVAIWDFLTFILLAADFHSCSEDVKKVNTHYVEEYRKEYQKEIAESIINVAKDEDPTVFVPEAVFIHYSWFTDVACALAIYTVFVVAAKGFTLWIINIVLGVIVWMKNK